MGRQAGHFAVGKWPWLTNWRLIVRSEWFVPLMHNGLY